MTDHAYHQDLVKQRDQAVADRKAAETELRQRRTQVAELTDQLATARAAASERAEILEHARDLLEPWGGHGDAWPDITPAVEALIAERLKYGDGYNQERARAEQAEARVVELTASLQPTEDALTRVCRLAETLPADVRAAINAAVGASPRELVDRWCLREELEQADTRYVEAACRANQAEARIAAVRAFADRDQDGLCCSHVIGDLRRLLAAIDGATTSTAAEACEHRDPKRLGARPGDLALVCACGTEVFPSPLPTQARP